MIKLRHIVGANLKALEAQLEKIQNSIIITAINNVGGNWFIHFLVQDTLRTNDFVAAELNIEEIEKANTKNLRRIKK